MSGSHSARCRAHSNGGPDIRTCAGRIGASREPTGAGSLCTSFARVDASLLAAGFRGTGVGPVTLEVIAGLVVDLSSAAVSHL